MITLNENDRILIVRLTALGDCIHTIPLACAIKKAFPNIYIGWAVSDKCKDVILNNPVVDKVHIIPKKDSKGYIEAIKEIKKEGYTVAIDSQELLKSALVSFLSGAKTRIAHDKSREFSFLFANKKLDFVPIFDLERHVIERNLDFVKALGIKNPQIEFELPQTSNEDDIYVSELLQDLDKSKKTVVLAPMTTWITKFWTKEAWAGVIKFLSDKVNIVVTGGKNDIDYVKDILSLSGESKVINLVGKTNLLQLKAVFEKSDILITPDSGSAHLGSAIENLIVICLFGATSKVRNAAYGVNNKNISCNLDCQPCYKKRCKYKEGIPDCMSGISVETVVATLKDLI